MLNQVTNIKYHESIIDKIKENGSNRHVRLIDPLVSL
jgi:hypothetical protein